LGALALGALLTVLIMAGWRWGLPPRALPQASSLPAITVPRWGELQSNSTWYWVGRVSAHPGLERLRAKAEVVHPPATTIPGGHPGAIGLSMDEREETVLDELVNGLLAATNRARPEPANSQDARAVNLLRLHLLRKAGLAEFRAQARHLPLTNALDQLVLAWQLESRFAPPAAYVGLFDERDQEQVNDTLAEPWRRIVQVTPALSQEDGRRWITQLAEVEASLSSLEQTYLGMVARHYTDIPPPWQPEWRLSLDALTGIGRLGAEQVRYLWQWGKSALFGTPTRLLLGDRIGSRLVAPFVLLSRALQTSVAKPADFLKAREAFVSLALTRAQAGATLAVEEAERAEILRQLRPTGWRRNLDRPAIWRALDTCPLPVDTVYTFRLWRMQLRSCQMALALRLYRDRHNSWPTSLNALQPEYFSTVPADPFTGRPFGYELTANGWRFWAAPPGAGPPVPEERPQRLFTSP
jgi:hypothetical protein